MQNSVTLKEKIEKSYRKSCKKARLFDLFIGLTIGLLELFLDHQMQNFKKNKKVPKSAYSRLPNVTTKRKEPHACTIG